MPISKKNIKPLRRKPAAGTKRGRKPNARNYNAALWTVPMCCEWSGFAHPYLLKLIHAGIIGAVALGRARDDARPTGTVHRTCTKFLVPARAFRQFVESLSERGELSA